MEFKQTFFFSPAFAAIVESMESYRPTPRTQVKRRPTRGVYDKAQVHAILDAGYLCHLGYVIDGQPFVIPTAYVRSGE